MKLGLYLIIIGLLMIGLGIFTPFATVVYDSTPPEIKGTSPAVGDVGTPLTPGKAIVVRAIVYDESGIEKVSCDIESIAGAAYSETLTLSFVSPIPLGEVWETTWTVPTLEKGATLELKFQVQDKAGNTATETAIGIIGVPDGYFEINSQRADTESIIYINMAQLNFKFTATEDGNLVDSIWVTINREDGSNVDRFQLTETTEDTVWEGSYALPGEGTYKVIGHIKSAGQWFLKMSIFTVWGEEEPGRTGFSFNMLTIGGLFLTGVGFILTFTNRGRRKRTR